MSNQIQKVSINYNEKTKQFDATVQSTESSEGKSFDTFAEANAWINEVEAQANDTPEKAASEMDEADAEEINSNVHTHLPAGSVNTPNSADVDESGDVKTAGESVTNNDADVKAQESSDDGSATGNAS